MPDPLTSDERCPSCKGLLSDGRHRKSVILTEDGHNIPVVFCPHHPLNTMTVGIPDAMEPPGEQGAPIDAGEAL
jgi:hypothetical protein